MKVMLYRDYVEDNRNSMNIYADRLAHALRLHDEDLIVNEFQPSIPKFLNNQWGLRLARFILYPKQAPHPRDTIIHIIEHGYAHLAYTTDLNKTIVTVHDLIPLLSWKGLMPKGSRRIPILVLYSLSILKRVKHIVSVSSNTRNDLINLLGCEPSKITVIYSGVDSIFKPYNPLAKIVARNRFFGIEPKKLILITGSQFYKNHETALKTLAILLNNGLNNFYLVKTGNPTQEWLKLVQKYELDNNVINIGFIPREQMPDLYNAVDVLLFPSLYEGFGWPPLEAMACGTPAVTSNVASLPEIMGAIKSMYDPFDSQGFAKEIQLLFTNMDHRQRIIKQGLLQSAKFTWNDMAKQVMEVYKLVNSAV